MSTQLTLPTTSSKLTAFEVSPPEQQFVSYHLLKVSRSFALVIPVLEAPLDTYIGTAYLVCRVCDNIEDCHQPFEWKEERFRELEELLHLSSRTNTILEHWDSLEWPGLHSDEEVLMGLEGLPLWELLSRFPQTARQSIVRWALEMMRGMLLSLQDDSEEIVFVDHVQVLRDEEAFDQYCYFVAGTVGWMCSELTVLHYELEDSTQERLEEACEAFGRALQKTNILKDFARDLKRGFSYIPATWHEEIQNQALSLEGAPRSWSEKVLESILDELREAVEYILALPLSARGYRIFCLRAVLPAYQTLLEAALSVQTLFTDKHHIKISRETLFVCLEDAELLADNNPSLREYRSRLESKIRESLQGL